MYKLLLLLSLLGVTYAADTYKNELPSTNPWDTIYQYYKVEQPSRQPEYYPTQITPAPDVMYDYRAPTYDIYHYDKAPIK